MAEYAVRVAETTEDIERVCELFEAEWPGEGAHCRRLTEHPRYRSGLLRFIELDGRVVCAAALRHDRWLVDGVPLDIGFVADILTQPDYRRRGLFRALLADCVAYFQGEGYALCSLHGAVDLYAPCGFRPVRWHSATTLPLAAALALPTVGRERQAQIGDLADMAALYDVTARGLAASEERTEGIWYWLWAPGRDLLLLEDENGLPAAYAWIEQRLVRRKLRVIEAAATDGHWARALLAALGRRAQQAGVDEVYLALAPDHPLARAAALAGGETRLVGPESHGSRWGHEDQAFAPDVQVLLTALAPVLTRRLANSVYAGWQGNLAIDTELGSASLEIGAAGVQGAARDGVTQGVLRLPAPLLAPLALGTYSARDIVGQPGAHADAPLLGLLDVLFPPRWPCSENEDWWEE